MIRRLSLLMSAELQVLAFLASVDGCSPAGVETHFDGRRTADSVRCSLVELRNWGLIRGSDDYIHCADRYAFLEWLRAHRSGLLPKPR